MKELRLEPCEPPLWARGGHAQTILGYLLPSVPLRGGARPHLIPLPDGDVLVIFFYPGISNTVVSVFHGLGGTSEAPYMARTAELALRRGHSVLLVNHRGCGAGVGRARRPYHSGRGEDISEVLRWARREMPGKRQLAVGYSLSGSALLNLVTGRRGEVLPDAAVTVNAPIDLAAAAVALKQGLNRIYDYRFVQELRRTVRAQEGLRLRKWMSLGDFDELYTAPRGGFDSAADYYARCSTVDHFDKIQVPTIVLSAEDDPFVPVEAYRRVKPSANVQLHLEKCGGHMGYLTRKPTPLGTKRWLDYAIDEAIKCLELNSSPRVVSPLVVNP